MNRIEPQPQITRWARWLGTFVGFPLAGLAARALGGDIDAPAAAAIGGLAGGAVLGAVQATVGGLPTGDRARWVGATAAGLAVGLTIGASAVGYQVDAPSLVAMGATSGAGVGLAQAFVIPMRGVDRALWAVGTTVLWSGGWLITSQVIVDAERHHAMFGSSGALVVGARGGGLDGVRGAGAAAAPPRAAVRRSTRSAAA
jgi:hypothetical protein